MLPENLPAIANPKSADSLSSPFDVIMHTDADGRQHWSAREMMPFLGYRRWENMENVVRKAKASCRNSGLDPSDHFRDITKYSKVVRKPGLDVQISRVGCYLIAMNGDPEKPEIAAAQQYFVAATRAAEIQAVKTVLVHNPHPWASRLSKTWLPHCQELNRDYPGHFTVVSLLAMWILVLEEELERHLLPTRSTDRPDVSAGLCWNNERRARGLEPITERVSLWLPDQKITVYPFVYPDRERGPFEAWFVQTYMPDKLANYLFHKPEFCVDGKMPPASVADNMCLKFAGRSANLDERVRAKLFHANGFFPASGDIYHNLFQIADR